MPRLLDRNKQIPNGFKFVIPQIRWQAPAWASFHTIVQGIIAARKAHPQMMVQYGWSVDEATVADELDEYSATWCLHMGWGEGYVANAAPASPPSFIPAPHQTDPGKLAAVGQKLKNIWSGVRTLNDWLDSNEPSVPAAHSAARAVICSACPKNVQGSFDSWFTKPAAAAIQRQLEKAQSRNLSTPDDAKLNICDVCSCPMKLKVHTPLAYIKQHLTEEVSAQLRAVPGCWIPIEIAKG